MRGHDTHLSAAQRSSAAKKKKRIQLWWNGEGSTSISTFDFQCPDANQVQIRVEACLFSLRTSFRDKFKRVWVIATGAGEVYMLYGVGSEKIGRRKSVWFTE